MQKVSEFSLTKFLKWFLIFSVVSAIVGISVALIFFKEKLGKNLFKDFVETLAYCFEKNPYAKGLQIHSMYPPIAFLILFPFALVCKQEARAIVSGEGTIFELSKAPKVVACAIVFELITLAIIIFAAAKLTKLKGKNLAYFVLIMLVWGPFFYACQLANTIFLAALFILLFFAFYKSEKRWQKELSLLFLALAISIKIYPVFIALIFVKNREWKNLIKTAIYSMLLVFVPFAFVDGNFFENIKNLLSNFGRTNKNLDKVTGNISIWAVVCKLKYIFPAISHTFVHVLAYILKSCLFVFSILLAFVAKNTKNKFNFIWVVFGSYLLLQDVSMGYAIMTTLICFVFFVVNFNQFSHKQKVIYSIFFAVFYCPIFFALKMCVAQPFLLIAIYIASAVVLFKERKTQHN